MEGVLLIRFFEAESEREWVKMKTQLWIFGLPEERLKALKLLRVLGFRAVTIGKNEEAVADIVREGLTAHVVLGSFSVDKDDLQGEEYLARRLDGTPVKWFGSGCPNNPRVREESLNLVREAASIEGVGAVILDGIRFASPGEGIESFMTCFCDECRRKAADFGYDMSQMETSLHGILNSIKGLTPAVLSSMMKWASPIDLLHLLMRFPGVLEWLRFRADCIAEHVGDVRKVVRSTNARCRLGAYLFTPSLSYLVGQDYIRLSRLLDYVEPMIYRTGNGVACLNFEVAKMAADMYEYGSSLDQAEIQRFLFNLLGIDAEPGANIGKLREGITFGIVESEARKALNMVEASKFIPILFLDDPFLVESVCGAAAAGAKNLSFFRFSEAAENAVKTVAEILKEGKSD